MGRRLDSGRVGDVDCSFERSPEEEETCADGEILRLARSPAWLKTVGVAIWARPVSSPFAPAEGAHVLFTRATPHPSY